MEADGAVQIGVLQNISARGSFNLPARCHGDGAPCPNCGRFILTALRHLFIACR